MRKTSLALAVAASTLSLSQAAFADFIGDSKATLEARNFYFNRDFREGTGQSKSEEWAQGFILRAESGYTEGTVGFGLDAIGMLGFKLDSGDGTAGSGLLTPDRSSGGSQDYSSDLAVAAKVKVSKSVLKVGSMQFKNMAIASSDSRLTPQVFSGGQVLSQEIEGLTLDAARIREVNDRNSGDFQDMRITTSSGANGGTRGITTTGGVTTDKFSYLGGTYKINADLTAAYYHSELDDLYKQNSFNLVHVLPLGDKQSLKTDVRYARSTDDGRSNVDNNAFGAMLTYGIQDEKSWQARYDFNFASVGIPGLTFMTRFLSGDNIDRGSNVSEGKERERNTELMYVFQEGSLKNLGVRWRNATMRNNFGRDIDENRLIVSYTLPLL